MKIVIGLVGLPAAGKGTAAAYLAKKYGAEKRRFSNALVDILNRLYKPVTRDNQIKLVEHLRALFGEQVLADVIVEDIRQSNLDMIVIDGLRMPADLETLRAVPNFYLFAIKADIKIRFERARKRGEKPEESAMTFEEFEASHKRSTELPIPQLEAQADFTLDNNGSETELRTQIDECLKKIRD